MERWRDQRYGIYLDVEAWRVVMASAGLVELEHYYRPAGFRVHSSRGSRWCGARRSEAPANCWRVQGRVVGLAQWFGTRSHTAGLLAASVIRTRLAGPYEGDDVKASGRGIHGGESAFFRLLRAVPCCPRSRLREGRGRLVLQPGLRPGGEPRGTQTRRSGELALPGSSPLLSQAPSHGASIGA